MGKVVAKGNCRFCGAPAMLVDNRLEGDFPSPHTTGSEAAHKAPACKGWNEAIRRRKPALVLAS